jgi:hypothetical protein
LVLRRGDLAKSTPPEFTLLAALETNQLPVNRTRKVVMK